MFSSHVALRREAGWERRGLALMPLKTSLFAGQVRVRVGSKGGMPSSLPNKQSLPDSGDLLPQIWVYREAPKSMRQSYT